MNQDILLAAYHGDINALKDCINENSDINVKDNSGYTPLHWVCFMSEVGSDRLEMAQLLVEAGADVNSVLPDSGPSVLSTACQSGNYDVVKLLVENGADLNFNGDGETPLTHAVRAGLIEVVSLLLEKGADFNTPNGNGQTPIDVAEDYERLDMVELLKSFSTKH